MTAILGISAFYHDSAAALVVVGKADDLKAGLTGVRVIEPEVMQPIEI